MPDKNIPEQNKELLEEEFTEYAEPIPEPDPNFEVPQSATEQPVQTPDTISDAAPMPQTEMESAKELEPKPIETEDGSLEGRIDTLKKKLKRKKKTSVQMPHIKDELTERIEEVMQEGLADAYMELTPVQQQEFKMKGEEVAGNIRELMKKTHVKIKEIFKLLMEWLKMLPGINSFFLEQEAKIKADKIISIKNNQQE
ncbi:hypothetical protein HOF40_02180 [Candidatus Parcubacteria bacterium]|jgi:hypothetical protein|nr:hypothetical protein [Candidatus Parcubacteria bacterium]MBT3948872.1 hypothetical protein [Candidatus Parcubacteria bacterium]